MKLQFNTSPQAGINFLLYAVAPETEFKHGCKGFGLSVGAARPLHWCGFGTLFFNF